jgi:hypothetical protein
LPLTKRFRMPCLTEGSLVPVQGNWISWPLSKISFLVTWDYTKINHVAPFAGCIAEFISRFAIWSSLLPYHVSLTSVPHVELSLPKILGAPTKDSKLGSSCTYKANTRCYSWHPLGDNGTKNIKNDPHKILERWRITFEAQTSSLLRKQKRIEPLQNEWPVPNILLLEITIQSVLNL